MKAASFSIFIQPKESDKSSHVLSAIPIPLSYLSSPACRSNSSKQFGSVFRAFCLSICFFLNTLSLLALDPEISLNNYRHRHWGVEEGLANPSIRALEQSSNGYIWAATSAGLNRFNSRQFITYNKDNTPDLENSSINCLLSSAEGLLWVGTQGGAYYYLNGGFHRPPKNQRPFDNRILCLYQDKTNRLWIATPSGAYYWKKNTLFPVWTNGPVTSICEAPQGRFWLGNQKQLISIDETNLGSSNFLVERRDIAVKALCDDDKGGIWIGTEADGIYHMAQNKGNFHYTKSQNLCDSRILKIYRDSEGTVWIGTMSGISRIRKEQVLVENQATGLESASVYDFMESKDGNFWIAASTGMHCLNDPVFSVLTASDGLNSEFTTAVTPSRNGLLIGTRDSGVFLYRSNQITKLPIHESSQNITSLLEDHLGRIWVGCSKKGIDYFHSGISINYGLESQLADLRIFSIGEDKQGTVWIGTGKGLNCWTTNTSILNYALPESPQKSNSFAIRSLMFARNDTLWIGTDNGIYSIAESQTNHYTIKHGLPANMVYCIDEDSEGRLWAGTSDGIACFINNQWNVYPCSKDEKTHVFWLSDDGLGYLWFTTPSSISRVLIADILRFFNDSSRKVHTTSFHQDTGLLSTTFAGGGQPVGCQSSDGRLWFPTDRGIAYVNPYRLPAVPSIPPVHIEEIKANGKPVSIQKEITLPPDTIQIDFQFAAISYTPVKNIRYRYRLLPSPSEWINATNLNRAVFNRLTPGRYQFQVSACIHEDNWNETGDTVAITITPYFYQRTEFYLIVGIMFSFLGLFGIHRWKVRSLQARKIELENLVARRTEQVREQMTERLKLEEQLQESRKMEAIGQLSGGIAHYFNNLLTVILGNTCVLRSNPGNTEETKEYLESITHASNQITDLVRQLLAFGRRHWLKLDRTDINHFLQSCFKNKNAQLPSSVEIQWNLAQDIPKIQADTALLEQCLSNIVTNSLEAMPSGGKLVVRTFCEEIPPPLVPSPHDNLKPGRHVVVSVSDTGKGMSPNILSHVYEPFFTTKDVGKGTGLGLAVVYGIIKQHQGWIDIKSTQGKGTTVSLYFPTE